MLEGLVIWLLLAGASGWIVALAAAAGFALLLVLDWAVERRELDGPKPRL